MTANPNNLAVGQALLYVPERRRLVTGKVLAQKPIEVEIAALGRKWATLAGGRGRISIKTLAMDGAGYSSPGRCYLNREDWEANERRDEAWRRFFNAIDLMGARPPSVTEAQINLAAEALGIVPQ
jgi:hypothetical protein